MVLESMILPVSLLFEVAEVAVTWDFPTNETQTSANRLITNFMKNRYKGEIQQVCNLAVHSVEILKY